MDPRRRINSSFSGNSTPNSQRGSNRGDGRSPRLQIEGNGSARTPSRQLAIGDTTTSAQEMNMSLATTNRRMPGRDGPLRASNRFDPERRPARGSDSSRDQGAMGPNRPRLLEDGSSRPEARTNTFDSSRGFNQRQNFPGSRNISGGEEAMLPDLSDRDIVDVSDTSTSTSTSYGGRRDIRGSTIDGRSRQPPARSAPITSGIQPERKNARDVPPNRFSREVRSDTARQGPPNRTGPGTVRPSEVSQPPVYSQSNRTGPVSNNRASETNTQRRSSLYLGGFDLERPNAATRQPARNLAQSDMEGYGQSRQPTVSNRRGGDFDVGSPSSHTSSHTSTHRSSVVGHTPRMGYGFASFTPYSVGYFGYYERPAWCYPWIDVLPWIPYRVVSLPRQRIFTEISTDYFDEEETTTTTTSSSTVQNLDHNKRLAVVNRFYNGWRDAYTDALSGGHDLADADRQQIINNRQNLQGKQDDAVRRLQNGDQAVVQETLDQVKMDRQMAVDMPIEQVRWATPWIQEVWEDKHGQIS